MIKKLSITIFILGVFYLLNSPVNFPVDGFFVVEKGDTLRGISYKLKDANVIRSRTLFESFVIAYGAGEGINYSSYFFEKKLPVYAVAWRLSRGDHRVPQVKITIPEGLNTQEVADVFSSKLPNFDKDIFITQAKDLEGRLFPDTYFFFGTANSDQVLSYMLENFEKKIDLFRADILSSGKSEKDILVMASIIEREANGDEDRDVISGILWKRLSIGMALQADAAPETYESRGLPNSPIANPGLASIKAAIFPKTSSYLYYLHDKTGNIHYAKNYDEHRANIAKYLR